MKTDTIFYQLFQNFPSIFFELIGQPASTGDIYEFISIEVKQTAFRIDGLFLPTPGLSEQPIYFVEVQFQKDTRIYQRFFAEVFLYFSRYDCANDWRGVVVFKKRSLDPGVPPQYQDFLASQRVTQIYLDELGTIDQSIGVGVVRLVVESPSEVVNSARFLLNKARQEIVDALIQDQIVELIETIVLYKFPQMTRQEIEAMFGFKELKQTRYFQDVAQEAREQGRQEGRQEGKLEAVPRLIAVGLTVEQIADALELSVEQVQQVLATNNSN